MREALGGIVRCGGRVTGTGAAGSNMALVEAEIRRSKRTGYDEDRKVLTQGTGSFTAELLAARRAAEAAGRNGYGGAGERKRR